jgi:hypothetical protein
MHAAVVRVDYKATLKALFGSPMDPAIVDFVILLFSYPAEASAGLPIQSQVSAGHLKLSLADGDLGCRVLEGKVARVQDRTLVVQSSLRGQHLDRLFKCSKDWRSRSAELDRDAAPFEQRLPGKYQRALQ